MAGTKSARFTPSGGEGGESPPLNFMGYFWKEFFHAAGVSQVKEKSIWKKIKDIDKSSTVCSSAEYGEIKPSDEDMENGYVDMGELNPVPQFFGISLGSFGSLRRHRPLNK